MRNAMICGHSERRESCNGGIGRICSLGVHVNVTRRWASLPMVSLTSTTNNRSVIAFVAALALRIRIRVRFLSNSPQGCADVAHFLAPIPTYTRPSILSALAGLAMPTCRAPVAPVAAVAASTHAKRESHRWRMAFDIDWCRLPTSETFLNAKPATP
ncbi:hypothetical protein BCR44DRAFT_302475 [Catenaria anguillulae PL171]|uniref:Uncharacterized protein n=1 Tax=Catenaria anguillulae PL171 TaxID=765915 RepID=A0A1Y2HT16_9FUNG|nr:hypothetical protein BCR44DRAFT_302475 [Catenaria anguillulae PL171]